jgi:hypothetical protein
VPVDVVPRLLSGPEAAVLDLFPSHEFDGVEELRQQAMGVRVVGQCDCGCPTIDLRPDVSAPSAAIDGPLVPVELTIEPEADEPPGEVLLFIETGRMSSLEYVFYSDAAPSEWPHIKRLTVVER